LDTALLLEAFSHFGAKRGLYEAAVLESFDAFVEIRQ
jgi:hypothetical protein